jgi:hypothetical protein
MIGRSCHSTPETKEVLSASKNAMLGMAARLQISKRRLSNKKMPWLWTNEQ